MIKKTLRRVTGLFQSATGSYTRHNNQYEEQGKLDEERALGEKNLNDTVINSAEFRVLDLLKGHPEVSTAVDIGSGTGWSSAALSSSMKEIIAIEPSLAATNMAKELYPKEKYPHITWRTGFAEKELLELSLATPTLFLTGCVFSHIRDQEVVKICTAVAKVAPPGSVLAFAECWGDEPWHQLMWHVRTKDWWQAQLPDWELDFHGPQVAGERYHKGIWGVKKDNA